MIRDLLVFAEDLWLHENLGQTVVPPESEVQARPSRSALHQIGRVELRISSAWARKSRVPQQKDFSAVVSPIGDHLVSHDRGLVRGRTPFSASQPCFIGLRNL